MGLYQLDRFDGSFLFRNFADVCERIKATSKKLEKVRILSSYLQNLDKNTLPIVSRFLSGTIFPKGSDKEVYVGYSTLIDLILEISGIDQRKFEATYLKYGDLGLTAEELFNQKALLPVIKRELKLNDVYQEFEKMASIMGKKAVEGRKNILRGLLLDASPIEAKYLIKILTGELRIGLTEGLLEEAIAKAFNYEIEEIKKAQLVIGDVGTTALLAFERRIHEAKLKPMQPLSYMLADTMSSAIEIEQYYKKELYAEFKYDGIRVQAHKHGDRIAIYSRKLEEITENFPEVLEELKKIPHEFILDGEIVPFKDDEPLPFHELQRRLRRKEISTKIMIEVPVALFVYDLLYLDERILLDEPLYERRRILESLRFNGLIKTSYIKQVRNADEIENLFDLSKKMGHEGLVIKDPSSPYTPGKRGKRWVKLKKELDTLDVVIVATEYGHGKRAGLYSDYTFAVKDNEKLRIIGKAYSGLTDDEILEMTDRLKNLALEDHGSMLIVKPEIVLEVAFDSIQKSDRHDSGYALRFPRIKRIRYDKGPMDIDTLDKVKEIYRMKK
ncbi:MAG: ATP-dependent DNA ligase [archaeon]|nr:ATP-dependent DNA ligase [archaeon]MCP8313613.1 ATP-dependent DNA ligase [archaeon]